MLIKHCGYKKQRKFIKIQALPGIKVKQLYYKTQYECCKFQFFRKWIVKVNGRKATGSATGSHCHFQLSLLHNYGNDPSGSFRAEIANGPIYFVLFCP